MNRQERRLLNKTRRTFSWIALLCIVLCIWLKYKYDDVSYIKMDMESTLIELEEVREINKNLNKKIDSLISIKTDTSNSVLKKIEKIKKQTVVKQIDLFDPVEPILEKTKVDSQIELHKVLFNGVDSNYLESDSLKY
jgi:folate-dependent tRNA-U54 methylase TrmFO/GidA